MCWVSHSSFSHFSHLGWFTWWLCNCGTGGVNCSGCAAFHCLCGLKGISYCGAVITRSTTGRTSNNWSQRAVRSLKMPSPLLPRQWFKYHLLHFTQRCNKTGKVIISLLILSIFHSGCTDQHSAKSVPLFKDTLKMIIMIVNINSSSKKFPTFQNKWVLVYVYKITLEVAYKKKTTKNKYRYTWTRKA